MALTAAEQKEFMKLSVACLDPRDWETPLPDADKKNLRRLQELLKKMGTEGSLDSGELRPQKIKNYVSSDLLKQILSDPDQHSEFVGIEMRNHGTEEKPRMVLREWLYLGQRNTPGRKCAFIQNGKLIEAGRTISAAAAQRLQR